MTHDYISAMYLRGQDDEARRAIRAEISREQTPEDGPVYEPTEAEVDAGVAEYWEARRQAAYGPWDAQLEEIYDDRAAWESRIAQIKLEIPKP